MRLACTTGRQACRHEPGSERDSGPTQTLGILTIVAIVAQRNNQPPWRSTDKVSTCRSVCPALCRLGYAPSTLHTPDTAKDGELTGNNNDCNITKSSINTDLDSIVDTYSIPGTMYSTPYKQDDNNHSEDTSFSDTWEYIYSDWLEDNSSSYGPDMYNEEIIFETSTSHTDHHSPLEYVAEVTISDYGESLWDSAWNTGTIDWFNNPSEMCHYLYQDTLTLSRGHACNKSMSESSLDTVPKQVILMDHITATKFVFVIC